MFRRATAAGTLAVLLGFPHVSAAQTTTYHLHNENSSTPTLRQLKTTVPEIATVALQSGDLKNHPAEDSSLGGAYDTQLGVPGLAGIIPANATVTFTFWMKKTSAFGVVYPRAQLSLNWTPTATLCAGNGTVALTTTLQSYTFSCTLPSAVTMTTSDRLTLLPGYHMTQGPGNKTMKVELDIEGISPSTDSFVIAPNPVPPTITSLSPASGPVNWSVTVTGTNFGATQGSSTLKFNGTTATPTSWSSTSIVAPVPVGATTGPVVVTVNGAASNGVTFTVIPPPSISAVTPASGHAGDAVTITGTHFLATQGSSTVKFNGTTAAPTSWSDTSITAPIPAGATTGNVVVTVSNQASNGVPVIVIIPGTISGTITRATGGSAVSSATVQAVLAGVVKGTATSAANGTYTIANLDPGTYDVRVSATGFAPELRQSVAVSANVTTTLNIAVLQPGSISGDVTQSNGTTPIVGASVGLYQNAMQKGVTATNGTGAYSITGLHPGAYTLQVGSVGYATQEVGVTISENSNTTRNVSLQDAPTGQVTYVYDEIGRLVSVVDPGGNAATYRYDPVGNLTAIERPGSAAVSISEFTPNAGAIGAAVLIYGTGFSTTPSSNTVTFNGSAATVTAATANQLTVTVPTGATTGPIGVSAPGGSATTSTSFTVTAAGAGPPTITSFTPQIWDGTSTLTITGTNFDTTLINDRVSVNGMASSVLTATATSVNTQLPSVMTSSGRVSVSTPSGTAISTNDFFAPPSGYSSTNVQSTTRMIVGGSQILSFPVAGKFSLLVFDGTPGHHVAATLSSVTLGSGTTEIYDATAHRVASNSIGGQGFSGYVETTISSANSYTLLVGSTGSGTGNVTVTLSDSVDISGSITADGSPTTVSIAAPAQNAYLTFAGTAGQRISLLATNPMLNDTTNNCDVSVSLLKPNGTIFIQPTCIDQGGFVDTTVLPVSGTYRLFVNPREVVTGSVTLNLFTVPTDVTGSITPGGSPVTMTTTTPGQNGSLTFNGNTGDRISLRGTNPSLTNATFGCDLNVTILKPNGTPLSSTTCMDAGGFIDATTLPSTGVYTVSVDMVGPTYGSLTLTLYSVPADESGTITIDGTAVPMTLSTPGQNGSLTFSATANQRISLQSTTTSGFDTLFFCDVNASILKPDNSPLVNPTCMDAGGSIGATTIPTTGTYTIVVDPAEASTGSITFTLVSVP